MHAQCSGSASRVSAVAPAASPRATAIYGPPIAASCPVPPLPGDDFERLMSLSPITRGCFNCDRDANDPDTRSTASGPEPEAMDGFLLFGR